MKYAISIIVFLLFWIAVSAAAGPETVPGPLSVARETAVIFMEEGGLRHVLLTLARGGLGLAAAMGLALILGVPCGLSPRLMEHLMPLVAALQACPAIVWISLLMIWVGTGSVVPLAAVATAAFPVLFINTAQGVAALDRSLFELAAVYRVPKRRIWRDIMVPGIRSYWLAGLSYALAVCWKVTATAEFIGSADGIGSRIYWSYRFLNMPAIFAWSLLLVLFGVSLELGLVRPLRRLSQARGEGAS